MESPVKNRKFFAHPLLLGAILLLCWHNSADAIEFKAKGIWVNLFEWGEGGNFVKKNRQGVHITGWDHFTARPENL